MGLNMLPMISFSVPTFSPPWIEWIPSYSALFVYDEILFLHEKPSISVLPGCGDYCCNLCLRCVGQAQAAFGQGCI